MSDSPVEFPAEWQLQRMIVSPFSPQDAFRPVICVLAADHEQLCPSIRHRMLQCRVYGQCLGSPVVNNIRDKARRFSYGLKAS